MDKTAAGSRIAGRKRIVAGESETAAGNLGNLDSEVVVGSEIAGTAAVVGDFHCVMIVVGKCHSATNETSEGGIDHAGSENKRSASEAIHTIPGENSEAIIS